MKQIKDKCPIHKKEFDKVVKIGDFKEYHCSSCEKELEQFEKANKIEPVDHEVERTDQEIKCCIYAQDDLEGKFKYKVGGVELGFEVR